MRRSIMTALSSHELAVHDKGHDPVDLVISCGGFYGFYVIGVEKIIKKLQKNGFLSIRRYAGSSVGAFCSVLMCCGVSTIHLLDMYERIYNRWDYFLIVREEILRMLPPDAYIRCSGRVFIHAVEVCRWSIRPVVFSEFTSNTDLVDACMASSNFPYIISSSFFYRYRGRYFLDGCFWNVLPVFKDNIRQVVIRLYNLDYSVRTSVFPSDESIEGLVVKGAVEAEKFFMYGRESRVIQWYNPKHRRMFSRHRMMIISLCAAASGFFFASRRIIFRRTL